MTDGQKEGLHYYLFSNTIVYRKDNKESSRNLNVLIASSNNYVARADLDRSQFQTQVRYINELDPERKTQIVDVFIGCISYLGFMTQEEFHAGFDEVNAPVEETEVSEQETPNEG